MGMSGDLEVAVAEGSTAGPHRHRHCSASASNLAPCTKVRTREEAGMSLWKRTMDYLGLGPDDAYDDYDIEDDYEPAPAAAANPSPSSDRTYPA